MARPSTATTAQPKRSEIAWMPMDCGKSAQPRICR